MTDDKSQNNNRDKKEGGNFSGEVVNGFRSCRDLSDIVPLYSSRGLYLKPIAKVFVSVNLPQLKIPGKTISTWEVMEKVRILIRPEEFTSLKVVKSTLEFIRLEGDISDKCRIPAVLARLDAQRLNLAGFATVLKVRAAEAKDDFPTRHAWDSYFRDAKHMNELKAGERPDTIHIAGLPVKWFAEDDGVTPSESLVSKIFKKWGTLRRLDIPAADPYRSRMRLGTQTAKFSFEDGLFFDAYVQYNDYMGFVKAMDDLRGMKILKKEQQSYLSATLKVDFDKTKHMSDTSVSTREFERKRLIAQDNLAAEKLKRKEEAEAKRREEMKKKEEMESKARHSRRLKREEKRKRKALTEFRKQEEDKVSLKIAREERKLIKAQRQLESIRLLDELFDRIKTKIENKEIDISLYLRDKSKEDKSSSKASDDDSNDTSNSPKKKDKKEKKLKKKAKKEKLKRKKKSKDDSSSDDSDEMSGQEERKKLKSVLNKDVIPERDKSLAYPDLYPRIPPHWYYEHGLPVLYPPRGGRNFRGRFPRGRGRGRGWRNNDIPRGNQQFNPHLYNEQYYKYFASLTGQEYHSFDSDSESTRSRSTSHSRRSRSPQRRRSKSRSKTRSRSRSRRRNRSDNRSRTRSKSRSRSKTRKRSSRTHSKSQDAKSRSRSRSRRKSRSGSRRKSKSKSPVRSTSRRYPKDRRRYGRSRSKVRITSARSRSRSLKRSRSSSSWSLPKSPARRSCSWSRSADAVTSETEKQKTTERKDDQSKEKAATAEHKSAS